jgi:hypothetical protein
MDQSDIKYILDMLNDAIASKDWDIVEEARDEMRDEYLDSKLQNNDDENT